MRWYTNNVKKVSSTYGNFRYDKIEAKSRKTDGFMALVAAMSCEDMIENEPEPQPLLAAVSY
jgi:phage terminase large subunit-like protein